jgi:hypothetical protein
MTWQAINESLNAIKLVLTIQCAIEVIIIFWSTELELSNFLGKGCSEFLSNAFLNNYSSTCSTVLASVVKVSLGNTLYGLFEIAIVINNDWSLATKF